MPRGSRRVVYRTPLGQSVSAEPAMDEDRPAGFRKCLLLHLGERAAPAAHGLKHGSSRKACVSAFA